MEPAEKRQRLTRRQFAELMLSQDGRCGCSQLPRLHAAYADFPVCNRKLSVSEGIIGEHCWPPACGGTNDLSNMALLRKPCADHKTREYDAWLIKKTRHNGGGRGSQQIKRARRKERTGSASSIPSRPGGFPKGQKLPTGAKIQGGRRMEKASHWPKGRSIENGENQWGRK